MNRDLRRRERATPDVLVVDDHPRNQDAQMGDRLAAGRNRVDPSLVTTRCVTTFCTSTVGDCPVTVTVSSSAPTRISTLTFAVNEAVSSMPSRFTVLKPGRLNVTV